MKLLVIVLENSNDLVPILDEFIDIDIKGATVLDAQGMSHIIADHVPLFARFAEITDPTKSVHKVIMTVIKDEERLKKAVEVVDKIVGGIENPDTGFMFTMPVGEVWGFASRNS